MKVEEKWFPVDVWEKHWKEFAKETKSWNPVTAWQNDSIDSDLAEQNLLRQFLGPFEVSLVSRVAELSRIKQRIEREIDRLHIMIRLNERNRNKKTGEK